jgi:uncharacterized coiled-coil protein SlyX
MNDYRDCSAERARIAELEEKIACLENQVACLEELVACLEDIIREALRASRDLRDWLQAILEKTQSILGHRSGIPRGNWAYARGADVIASQALAGVNVIISILLRPCIDCDDGCD